MIRMCFLFISFSFITLSLMATCTRDPIQLSEKSNEAVVADVDDKQEAIARSCSVDADCSETKADCCGCFAGGKKIAISTSALKSFEIKLSSKCEDKVCPQFLSNDPSCQKKPICKEGRCELK